ncbi:CapA family protein [Chondromyces apiculatus]|uniref:Capsule synthesis protein CapA domain-containing protein n=1 Tax=Chondromyces apiculatus DSM 436 TaxID=1192034 RepID=A0A017TFS8_9BACT|nr:CapA family protein [Chondromyces apiculatus]EYF07466.1 Hypothetical protein CAP_0219 [Chondromyces apiculatus DSM 436]
MRTGGASLVLVAAVMLSGCGRDGGRSDHAAAAASPGAPVDVAAVPGASDEPAPAQKPASPPSTSLTTHSPAAPAAARKAGSPGTLTLLAGGDVCLAKALGQALIQDPTFEPFAPVAGLLASADLRFANLESQISDQRGETQHPRNPLVFVTPPVGADVLARAGIDIVSLANNHMWDYGEPAFLDTLTHLERVGVDYAGAGRGYNRAYGPRIVERNGFRVAFLAVTDIWNQGLLWTHPAKDRVAAADLNAIAVTVRKLKQQRDIDAVVVSHHGGVEYLDEPIPFTRKIARAAIDAGADAFLGHHPHIFHGIELRRGRPIFYNLGSFLMKVSNEHPDAALGMLARLTLRRGEAPLAEVCPVRNEGLTTLPLTADPQRAATEAAFGERLRRVSGSTTPAAALGSYGPDGCAPLQPEGAPPVAEREAQRGAPSGAVRSSTSSTSSGKLGQVRHREPGR